MPLHARNFCRYGNIELFRSYSSRQANCHCRAVGGIIAVIATCNMCLGPIEMSSLKFEKLGKLWECQ